MASKTPILIPHKAYGIKNKFFIFFGLTYKVKMGVVVISQKLYILEQN